MFLNSLHEIEASLPRRTDLPGVLKCVNFLLRSRGGIVIVGEPQYSSRYLEDLERDQAFISIDAIKKIDEERIGHSHDPREYINQRRVLDFFPSPGFRVLRQDVAENKGFNRHWNKHMDIPLPYSPKEFHITAFEQV